MTGIKLDGIGVFLGGIVRGRVDYLWVLSKGSFAMERLFVHSRYNIAVRGKDRKYEGDKSLSY